jgi:hypothetical protein
MKASSIYEITGRPVPQTTNQTVGTVSNVNLTEQNDLTTALSMAESVDVFSPAPSASTAAPEREHQGSSSPVPLSSKGLLPHSRRTSVCVVSPPSVRFSEDIFIEEVVDDDEDDLHIQHDFPLGIMEITDEYIHSVYIIPHIKTNGDIQFRALKLDSSLPNKTEDHAHSSCASFRTTQHPTSRRTKKKIPKSLQCPVSVMSMTELEAMIADFNELPPTEYQVPQHTPKLL